MSNSQPTIAELDSALHTMLDENDALRVQITQLRGELERRDDELKRLVGWINGDIDALATLQRTYMDPKTSTSDRIKAAGAAIAYERPKLSVQVRLGPAVLGERLDQAKATIDPKVIEHQA